MGGAGVPSIVAVVRVLVGYEKRVPSATTTTATIERRWRSGEVTDGGSAAGAERYKRTRWKKCELPDGGWCRFFQNGQEGLEFRWETGTTGWCGEKKGARWARLAGRGS